MAQYIESVIRKALNYVRDKAKEDNEKLLKQIEACNKIVYILSEVSNEDDIKKYKISENGEMLTALYSKINNKRAISKWQKDKTNNNIIYGSYRWKSHIWISKIT